VTIARDQDEQAEQAVALACEEVLEGGGLIFQGANRDLDRSTRRSLPQGCAEVVDHTL
jgi:hypothetical protein